MPRIPNYTGSRQLATQPPSTLRDAASYVRSAEAQERTGRILSAAGETFAKVMDTYQYTQAQTESAKRLNDLYNKIQTEPKTDIWNAGKTVQDEMRKIKDETSSKILNQLVRDRFNADFDLDSMRTLNSINDHLRRRQADTLSASGLEFIDTKKEEFFRVPSGVEQQMVKAEMKGKVDELVNLGAWEKEKAYKYWQETEAGLRAGQVLHDADIDATDALAELQKGKNGFYPDLTEDERRGLIEKVGQKIEKAKKEAERNIAIAQNQNESEMLTRYYNNELTEGEIDEALTMQAIRPEFAVSIRRALSSPKSVNAVTDYQTYEDIMEMILDPNVPAITIRKAILDARSNGKLKESDVKSLMFVSKTGRDTSVFEDYLRSKGIVAEPKRTIWHNIWSFIKGFVTGAPEDQKIIMDRVVGRVTAENATDDNRIQDIAKEEVKKKVIEDYPDIVGFEEEGRLMIDAFGNIARVYPDGRIVEEGEGKE